MPKSFSSWYVAEGMRASQFLPRGFGDASDRLLKVKAAAARTVSPALVAELIEQDKPLPESATRRENIRALATPGTVVVATGQQVGLFLGPLYTLYKAASAVVIARRLSEETGVRCVPLFWLQTEDHDFDEIAKCTVPVDRRAPLLLHIAEDSGEDRCSISHRSLGRDIADQLEALKEAIGAESSAPEVMELLQQHYRPGASLGHAFAGVLASLFADDGLIVFNPRRPAVARLAAPILRRAIADASRINEVLVERASALEAAGFEVQVPLRSDCALAFFHRNGVEGSRYRLPIRDGRVVSDEESDLLALVDGDPLRFSTSALLRPILQDTLFPTVVYVGGPAEVSYFAQLPPLYALFGMEPPLVAERAHLRLVPARVRSLMQKLGLDAADMANPRAVLAMRALAGETAPSLAWAAELESRLDSLSGPGIDESVRRQVDRLRRSVRHGLGKVIERHSRAALERDEVTAQRLSRIEGWLTPGGAPQERVHSFPAFAARVGLRQLHDTVLSAIDPFNPAVREIDL